MKKSFSPRKALIGMIHVGALPGTPRYEGRISTIIKNAETEAAMYHEAGFDAVMIENMHDVPYLRGSVGPEIVAAMSILGLAVKNAARGLPCGIQILAGANREALAAALAAKLDFIRAEGFVFAHIADEGIIESCAGDLLRYRRAIGAEHIAIFTDIKKKHSAHAITDDVSLVETAHAAQFFLSDGVIITGAATGQTADLNEIRTVKAASKIPVLVGSGVTAQNLPDYLAASDGIIVGSSLKRGGQWQNPLEKRRLDHFVAAALNFR